MANSEHLAKLKEGVKAWNEWREDNQGIRPDLRSGILRDANLRDANLRDANLGHAVLTGTSLKRANLGRAVLRNAILPYTSLEEANLRSANLRDADLRHTNLRGADLENAEFSGALLRETTFSNVDLSETKGLDKCAPVGPCTIDHRTLTRSGPLPKMFLRGCGLSDEFIEYIPSIFGENPIQFYSCFISYASKDEEFAKLLHADIQSAGVRCWFAPEDMKIGDRIDQRIDHEIRVREKLLLILSEPSVASAWVTREVKTALEEEDRHGKTVLFPVRLDGAVVDSTEQWAHDIRRQRHIGDFTNWKDHDSYKKAFDRLLRDLKVENG